MMMNMAMTTTEAGHDARNSAAAVTVARFTMFGMRMLTLAHHSRTLAVVTCALVVLSLNAAVTVVVV